MAIGVQQFPILSPEQMSPTGNLLQNALQKFTGLVNASYLPKEKASDLQKSIADALIKQAQAKFAPQMEEAKLATEQSYPDYYRSSAAHNYADANRMNTMTPLDALKQGILNKFLPQREQAEIDETKQRGNYYAQGGGRGGLGSGDKSELFFQSLVGKDNPQLAGDPDKIYEASNVLRAGGNKLRDGTPLNPLSPASEGSYNRVFKSGTTSPLITAGIKANSAEAEMPVFDKYISEGRKPYGNTVLGVSPQQLSDSANSNNPKAAERLGKYIASDMLAFDKAALQTRIAGTESGVTIIEDVMKRAQQTINAKYPRLSDNSRQVALETMGKALREALKARNKYGIGAAGAVGADRGMGASAATGTPEETRQVGNETLVKINGQWFHQD